MIVKFLTLSLLLFILVVCQKQRLLIGGSLDQNSHIINLLRGKHVALITAAGDNPQEDAKLMQQFFGRRGINTTWVPLFFPCRSRSNFDDNVEIVEKADAVYFSGGFSEKLQRCLFGDRDVGTSEVLEAVRRKNFVGGSSAGAMVMPQRYMLLTGNSSSSYGAIVRMSLPIANETFKISNWGVVDPHMSERARQGRLLVFTTITKNRWGFGLDENTGYVENEDGSIKVTGQRGIVVYDRGTQNLERNQMTNIKTHYLSEGDVITKEGNVVLPEWKKDCTVVRVEPRVSQAIFNQSEFRTRMIQISRFERPIIHKGYHGQRPTVFVEFEKHAGTKAACGIFNGNSYTSIVDLKVSMGVQSVLPKGINPPPHVERKYIDNCF